MDISSKELAKTLKQIKEQAMSDTKFKMTLLANPSRVLEAHSIQLGSANFTIEDISGYGLMMALTLPDNPVEQINSELPSDKQNFTDTHFMDCHHY